MEKLLLSFHVPGVTFKFLNPTYGERGCLQEASYYLATNFQVTAQVMAQSPELRLVTRTGVGYDNVDIDYAKRRGIPVTIARGGNAASVAELVVLQMLVCLRKFCPLVQSTKAGAWQSWDYRHESYELKGKTVGIIGSGMIGQEVIRLVNAFGADCIYYDVYRLSPAQEAVLHAGYAELDDLLARSDLITMHIPSLESTRGFIGRRQLEKMKSTAYLINTARGQIIDEDALVWALDQGEIAGAALDVFCANPPGADSPLLRHPNVLATPHIGGATIDAYRLIFSMCVENIRLVEEGREPRFIVNP